MKPYRHAAVFLGLSMLDASPSIGSPTAALDGTDGGPSREVSIDRSFGRMPLYFVENRGQLDGRVGYYLQGQTAAYFTGTGITYAFSRPSHSSTPRVLGTAPIQLAAMSLPSELPDLPEPPELPEAQRWAVAIDLVGARRPLWPEGDNQTPTIVSYFKGPQSQWKVALPTYQTVVYRDVWPGIDLDYSVKSGQLKYTFVVQPGADPRAIKLRYRGAASVQVEDGELLVETPLGGIRDQKPLVYQDADGCREEVAARHTVRRAGADHVASFTLGPYDHARPLVIDPVVLAYCGYIGGSEADGAFGIAVDDGGNAYVTGFTASSEAGFPIAVGPDLTYNGGQDDAFVAKVRADGTGLVYAGYVGGSDWEWGSGIAVDAAGNAYVTGPTRSSEGTFPVTVGPDLTHNGGSGDPLDVGGDAFVVKVKADGTGLEYAGYIGGHGDDVGRSIAVDDAGNAYVTGWTNSPEGATFPVTVGPDLTFNGGGGAEGDAFVAKVRTDGSGLVYAGYVGGNLGDGAYGIAVDSSGNAYIAGHTTSSGATFPETVGPDLTHNIGEDAFVAKVRADGTGLAYAGYVGGTGQDYAGGIAVDAAGSAYVTGETTSSDATFPVTVGPDLTFNGCITCSDAFVAKVEADGTGLVYAGYIGGSSTEWGWGIAVDTTGNAYVTGMTGSDGTSFPVTDGPDLTFNGGSWDAFVAKVRTDGTGLDYAGYIGGVGVDGGSAIAVDPCGNAYVCDFTSSDQTSFPAIIGPDLTFNAPGADAFVARVNSFRCCLTAVAVVGDLRAVKQQASLDDIDLSWDADPAASGYNIWYVTRAADIDLARQASQPPTMGVAGCSEPAPATGNACTDLGAVSRSAPTTFFYQVRASCGALSEGP